jgi:restriction system protein
MARGFISTLNALARSDARARRQAETAYRRQVREQQRVARHSERMMKLAIKEERQRYLESRILETEEQNLELQNRIQALQNTLQHTLEIDDAIDFDSLRIKEQFAPFKLPPELLNQIQPPAKRVVKENGWLGKLLPGAQKKYEMALQEAEIQYQRELQQYNSFEASKRTKIDQLKQEYEKAKQAFELKVSERNREVVEMEEAYKRGDVEAVVIYNTMVLERSVYADDFPQSFRVAYGSESQELVIEYQLPTVDIVPAELEYKYVKARDTIETKPRKATDIKSLYQDIVAAITLRTIHEVIEADRANHIQVVTFNGYVETVDPATGKDVKPFLVSIRATKEQFMEIDLRRIDKRACLRNLGAQVSPQPTEMISIKPIVEFDMFDNRFVQESDVISGLDSRPNLMELSPQEFESLVCNLFAKMGLESKLTQASRDGGIDVVAFDNRPIFGGKVVIQAKRYKNTVGVSAVRDLYGTLMNEGANKGILVTTSGFGSDAFNFANDKPIELIDGGGLLYLLEQMGVRARIILPES